MATEANDFTYTISDGALQKIALTTALACPGVVAKKGKGIVLRHDGKTLVVEVHLQVQYGVPLRTIALDVQQQVAQALNRMAAPTALQVHVTIEDIVIPE